MGRKISNETTSDELTRLSQISKRYAAELYKELCLSHGLFTFQEKEEGDETLDDGRYFILKVNQTLNAMKPKEREFLRNIFFSPQSEDWWNSYFCYATFSRMQRRACHNFLEEFDK